MKNQTSPIPIRQLREDVLKLTQVQFAALLGFGIATINRYENGTSPTPAHQALLTTLERPDTLRELLKNKEKVLGPAVHAHLSRLADERLKDDGLRRIAASMPQKADASSSGNRAFDIERLKALVTFFAQEGEWKTKLNKLLFYADFLSFKYLRKSLSGTRYVVGHYGPIPDQPEQLYASLIEAGVLRTREEYISQQGIPVEKLVANHPVNRNLFTAKELELLDAVRSFFLLKSAKETADYSHEDQAWEANELGTPISYQFARSLRDLASVSNLSFFSSIADQARSISAEIPKEELQKLPRDGAADPDKYLYGSKKRSK